MVLIRVQLVSHRITFEYTSGSSDGAEIAVANDL